MEKTIRVDEMKVQERWLFHFLTSLKQEKNYAQVSRFNPQIVVSFFNELVTERKTMLKAFVSFF
jgi:hypothetical protein